MEQPSGSMGGNHKMVCLPIQLVPACVTETQGNLLRLQTQF